MRGEAINDFLNDYRDRCEERNEEPIPKTQLRDILEAFVLTELWQDEDPTLFDVAFASLRRIVATDKAAMQIVKTLENEVATLKRKLDRQKAANAMLQEHVVMLSDQIAR